MAFGIQNKSNEEKTSAASYELVLMFESRIAELCWLSNALNNIELNLMKHIGAVDLLIRYLAWWISYKKAHINVGF